MAKILLGVGGGIAAYKAVYLLRSLVASGHEVTPVLTEAGSHFIGAQTLSALASNPCLSGLFGESDPIPHTHLGRSVDLICVAPATADLIAKFANGIANDLLSATVMASRAKVVVAPAMHEEMWDSPAVQRNLQLLRDYGYLIVPPSYGPLAAGDVGRGRMAEPSVISLYVEVALEDRGISLWGKKVVVSAGGTREPIDPVRFIGNRSSGKQGLALAKVAAVLGAEVSLVTTVAQGSFPSVTEVLVSSAKEMDEALTNETAGADLVVMAAAVSDYRVKEPSRSKIKRESAAELNISLEANPDILKGLVKAKKDGSIYIGFAAETDDLEVNLRRKLESKGVDIMVGNDVTRPGAGFEHDTNSVVILSKDGQRAVFDDLSKEKIALEVLTFASRLFDRP
ncbi:phosphopantothenoylcysteine decarboxylase / phosphopantothenate--cysteine ligase [Ferrithrix thermotolerans DSM 19514]|uniref:Coenzyme A biosynthesis bifunctional protein CoaBC n=1 Tax=Ferrithrix thermotolerans DSM 19514 TaxID=1121881 RepID=A0A1M4T778_9ACTN|nr:bifunctional phosphopantothenoylcysteine decarboxylase/phosphopantothenate--cysteine ligase CoaBC [Ferrithrix thermotolerans]SHE40265.1 phosphopantothenoylcysteine decarboxylase / phosphopantothenate--cysteine ligase [Ferrithrix thermotolerans DSM 19514]